jgi:glycosyltransferase involved in cell wall biosynthesis
MRILILTPRPPWPQIDGGRIAIARLACSLANGGADVEILSLNPAKHRAAAVAQPPLPMRAIDIDTSRLLRPALDALSGLAPMIVARFLSAEFRDALRGALRRFAPDVVQIESPFLLPYLGTVRAESRAVVALRSQNVEFRIWDGLARNERNPLRRLALRRLASSLRKYEITHLDAPDAIIPISEADADDFRRLGCTRPMHVVPCGVMLPELSHDAAEPGTVGFIGSLAYRPNQEAVEWIVDELWPRVRERASEARLSIAGSSPPDRLLRYALARGIRIEGDVDDAQAFMQRMSVMIAPLFAGGGMRIKVLEAMALAMPVVATTLGAAGIDVQHDRDILIANDAAAFADGIVRLLSDSVTARRIGDAARATVAERYDSDAVARSLLRFYASLTPSAAL